MVRYSSDDVAVIGGGIIGLSIAWELLRAGRGVTLWEEGRCGEGASGIDLAALWPTAATKQGRGHRLHRQSLWGFDRFVQELASESGLPILFARPGRMEIFTHDVRRQGALREADKACADWPSWSAEPVQQVLTTEQANLLEPAVAVGELGALRCDATAYVDAPALLAALRAAVIRRGGVIEEMAPVHDLWIDGESVRGIVTDRPVPASAVVVAAGARSTQLAPELAQSATVLPVKGQAILLRPSQSVVSRLIKKGRTYLIPAADGRVLVGSTSEPEAGFDRTATTEARDQLWESAIDMVPALADARFVRSWVGHRPQTPGRTPYLGPVPGVAGLYLVAGHFKIGIALAPMVGRLASQLVRHEPTDEDLSEFAPGRADP